LLLSFKKEDSSFRNPHRAQAMRFIRTRPALAGAIPKENRINHEGAKEQSYHEEEIFVPAFVPSCLRGKKSLFAQDVFGKKARIFFLERKKQRTFLSCAVQHP
jgi:hypothetical protein